MRYLLYVLTLTVSLYPVDAQQNPAPANQRALPDDNLAYPVLITLRNSTGSGFYLNTATATYLVTAGHVLFNMNTGQLLDTSFNLLSYSRDPSDRTPNRIAVNTAALGAVNIIRHGTMDVAVVRLFTNTAANQIAALPGVLIQQHATAGFLGVGLDNVKRFDEVLVGNEVILFGYPTSLGLQPMAQIDPLRPLLRKGIVAGQNFAKHSIILDCPAYPGNSGGPVIEIDEQGPFQRRYRMIGVVDQYVPYADSSRTLTIMANSGYSVIVPMDFVLELVR